MTSAIGPLAVTGLYAGLCAVLMVVLSLRVIASRKANRVSLGSGGVDGLERRIRAQGNAAEYLPIGLILLGVAEINGAPDLLLHGFGVTFLLGRVLHAYAFSFTDGNMRMRVSGMQLTIWSLLVMGVYTIVAAVLALYGA